MPRQTFQRAIEQRTSCVHARVYVGLEPCKDLTAESHVLLSLGMWPDSFLSTGERLIYPFLGTVTDYSDLVKTQLI